MKIHRLAIFWRDQQARAFTSFHFTVPPKETAKSRAEKILSVFDQLTDLQIYGAVVDDKPLAMDLSRLAPLSALEKRVEVNLHPDAPLAARNGIVPIGFTILGPNEKAACLPANTLQQPAWQLLEKELLPFICLTVGAHIAQQNPIKRIELVTVNEDKRPQPGEPPIDSAIVATEKKVDTSKAQLTEMRRRGQEPTGKDIERFHKHQDHLAWLNLLKEFEEIYFADAVVMPAGLPINPIGVGKIKIIPPAQEIVMSKLNSKPGADKAENKLPAVAKELTGEEMGLLPSVPQQQELWADIPQADFADAGRWLHRELFKQEFNLPERSYYRWIDILKAHGLNRSLPAQQQKATKLFYRTDVEKALREAELSGDFRKPGRPSEPASQPVSARRQVDKAAVSLSSSAAVSDKSNDGQNAGGKVDQNLSARLDALALQQQAIVQLLAMMNDKFERLAVTIANQPAAQDFMSRALDILANFASFNNNNSHLLATISKLDNKLKSLPASIANARKAAAKPIKTRPIKKMKRKSPVVQKKR